MLARNVSCSGRHRAGSTHSAKRVARRKLLQIHAATELASLRIPPGNQLEASKADRRGQRSIRVNDQWRLCFVWKSDGAHNVEIVEHR